ncbi:MAG: ABC transporter ATP-binding protein [Candidatus Brocadiia bacterium]
MPIAELKDVWRTYRMGHVLLHALQEVDFAIGEGDMIAIMGPSGSGKSTLLNLLGCLDRPTRGQYLLGGEDVSTLSDDQLSEIRANRIGFIFQSYNLIPQLNVVQNIEIPLYYKGVSEEQSYERAVYLAQKVGLGKRLGHHPTELSGGERQRVGVARALANQPLIVLADEPTGNLDTKTGGQILKLLHELNRDGVTLIVVTHDPNVAATTQQTYRLVDGRLAAEQPAQV